MHLEKIDTTELNRSMSTLEELTKEFISIRDKNRAIHTNANAIKHLIDTLELTIIYVPKETREYKQATQVLIDLRNALYMSDFYSKLPSDNQATLNH